jgi:hypothetical protein
VSAVRTGHTSPGRYEIRVQGRLEPRWAAWFDGFTLSTGPGGTTVISGTVIDQAALHGLLQSLRDLGLPLLSVTQPQDDTARSLASDDPATDAAQPPSAIPAQEEPR